MKIRTVVTAIGAALALAVAVSALAPNGNAETVTPSVDKAASNIIDEVSGIRVPDSKLARDAAQVIRDGEGDLLFQHSARVFIGRPWQESARV
jgi:hypothetical protein